MPSGNQSRFGPDTSGVTARSAAVTGAKIGASIGSRAGPVGAGVGSGFGGAVGFLIGSSLDGIMPIPDGGHPTEDVGAIDRSDGGQHDGGDGEVIHGDQTAALVEGVDPLNATDTLTTTPSGSEAVSDESGSRHGTTADEEPVVIDVVEE